MGQRYVEISGVCTCLYSWTDHQADPPNLHFVAQIPESDLGEQLVSQWIGCMANRSWIFKYGRVKLSLIVRPALYDVSDTGFLSA
jgi:hypothetical protein